MHLTVGYGDNKWIKLDEIALVTLVFSAAIFQWEHVLLF